MAQHQSMGSTDPQYKILRDLFLGLQHVLVMYAGTITVPIILGSALKLSKDQIAYLINADLFAAGVVTIIQSIGLWGFGIRLPIMMGVTFAAVSPMIAIAQNPSLGIPGLFGAVIASGIFGILVAPFMGRLIRFFPPVVTGCIITLIGFSLMKVGINWSAGGQPMLSQVVNGQTLEVINPAYGGLENLAMAFCVLLLILSVQRFSSGIVKNLSVLIGLVVGTTIYALTRGIPLQDLSQAPWLAVVKPLYFGLPTFDFAACVTLSLVMIVILAESLGIFLVVGNITGRPVSRNDIIRGLRADGLGAVIGGIFNTFPYTSFSQNVGLLAVTNVRGAHVTAIGGGILMLLSFLPKIAILAASIPYPVLGGAAMMMFGMVAATGIRILKDVDFDAKPHSILIIAVSLSIGMIPALAPQFFQHFPSWTHPFIQSGIVLGSMVAIVLNVFLNGILAENDSLELVATSHKHSNV